MRFVAGLAMIAMGLGAAGGAHAQTLSEQAQASSLANAAFAPRAFNADTDDFARILERQAFDNAGRPVRWSSSQMQLTPRDSVRVTLGSVLEAPGGLPLNLDRAQAESQSYEVAVIRNWPRALSFDAGKASIDLSPHAGLGVGNTGGSAEAGAELRLQSRDDRAANALRDLGVKDGAQFGDQGRWYLFAAAGARAVGLNMLRGEGGWDRAGWTTDPAAALIGDAQVGVGYRKGSVQTSFGVIHREVKGEHRVFGQETRDDTIAAFSLSIKPRAR